MALFWLSDEAWVAITSAASTPDTTNSADFFSGVALATAIAFYL